MSFALVFGIRKQVPTLSCGVVYVILRVPVLVEHRLVTDRQTDRQTDRHTTTAYSALTWRRAVIKLLLPSLDAYQTVWHLRRVVLLTENENEQNAVRYGIFSVATGLHLIFINDVTVIWST